MFIQHMVWCRHQTIFTYLLHCGGGSVAKILHELVTTALGAFLLQLAIFSEVGVLSYKGRSEKKKLEKRGFYTA